MVFWSGVSWIDRRIKDLPAEITRARVKLEVRQGAIFLRVEPSCRGMAPVRGVIRS